MFDRILFPTDGSDGANAVLDHVLDLADAHDATLHILSVADTTHDSVTRVRGEIVDVLEREGEEIVEEAAARAEARGVSVLTDVIQGGVPATITAYAEEYDIDLVAMPTRGRTGVKRLLLGSTAERVVRSSTAPVLTVRPDDAVRYPYRSVLVPTDGSEAATAALDRAIALATEADATLHLLSVVEATPPGLDVQSEMYRDQLRSRAEEIVEDAAATAESAGVESISRAVELDTSVDRAIGSYVDDNGVDLVVMGTHGRTGLERYLLGSVAERTVRTAPVPVLSVPAPGSGSD
jgi:nucleotide-binding universal stress UspA family protein